MATRRAGRWPDAGPNYFANVSAACVSPRDLDAGTMFGPASNHRPAMAAGW